MLTARWLGQAGASALVLASRGGALAPDSTAEWAQLHATGAVALVERCDTAEDVHVQRLVAVARQPGPMGIWHSAGMLADGLLPNQTAASLTRVYAPKAHGAGLLQAAAGMAPLRTCVLFSSVAALLGGAGQSNYSAANSALDAHASWRHASGRACVSVQWGAWAQVGMASRGAASERMAAMEAASGFGRIAPAQGLAALGTATLSMAPSLLGVMPVQWGRMLGDATNVPAFLAGMAPPSSKPVSKQVAAAQAVACSVVSLEAVLEIASQTAGGTLDADTPLMEAGIDSLGAVELRNQLQRAAGDGITLSSTLIFDHPTARQVAQLLHGGTPKAVCIGGSARVAADSSTNVQINGVGVLLPKGVTAFDVLREMSHGGHDLLCEIPATRWDAQQALASVPGLSKDVAGRVRHGAFLQSAQLFDHGFFSISAAEASSNGPSAADAA